MKTKPTLRASTPVGDFTRQTATPYTHIVVWNSPRAAAALQRDPNSRYRLSGVDARWVKDRGYGVTWHSSLAAAVNAGGRYKWDVAATCVGVFPVNPV